MSKNTTFLVEKPTSGLAILTINSTKNHGTFERGYILFIHVTEYGWVRRGGKGGCDENFLKNCLSEYNSLFHGSDKRTETNHLSLFLNPI